MYPLYCSYFCILTEVLYLFVFSPPPNVKCSFIECPLAKQLCGVTCYNPTNQVGAKYVINWQIKLFVLVIFLYAIGSDFVDQGIVLSGSGVSCLNDLF